MKLTTADVIDRFYKLVPPKKEFRSVPNESTRRKLRKKRKKNKL